MGSTQTPPLLSKIKPLWNCSMVMACRFYLICAVCSLSSLCKAVSAFPSSSGLFIDKRVRHTLFRCFVDISKHENEVGVLSSLEDQQPPMGLYVHIPYCRRRCRYCNFAIVPIGTNVETDSHHHSVDDQSQQASGFHRMNQEYTAALLKELHLIQTNNDIADETMRLQSIYFGGGTPSLMPIESLRHVMSAILDVFHVDSRRCEITLEVDPGTFSVEKMQAWKNLGVNRLSLGVQSFNDTLLESLGRVHRLRDIYDSVAMIREVFGDDVNYSIDLISGLPGLSIASWVETLQIATTGLQPRPKHLSVYDLQIEEGTVFGNLYGSRDNDDDDDDVQSGRSIQGTIPDLLISSKLGLRLPSSRDAAFMYKYTAGYLRYKQFEHYEISSYAASASSDDSKPRPSSPYRSQHNQIYWGYDTQWYAIGLGASSFVGNVTLARPRTMSDYLQWVHAHASMMSSEPVGRDTILDELESIVLKRLRTSDGLSLRYIQKRYGTDFVEAIWKGIQLGCNFKLVSIDDRLGTARLTDPSGFLFSNSIISSIFYELEAVDARQRNSQIQKE